MADQDFDPIHHIKGEVDAMACNWLHHPQGRFLCHEADLNFFYETQYEAMASAVASSVMESLHYSGLIFSLRLIEDSIHAWPPRKKFS